MPVEQLEDHPPADPQLVGGQARDQRLGQDLGIQVVEVGADLRPKLITQRGAGEHRGDRLVPGRLVFEGVLQQFGHVEDLDAVLAQDAGETVVFLLGPADPRQRVEQQPCGVARRDPSQLETGTVHQDRPESPDFTVHAVRVAHITLRSPDAPLRDGPWMGVSPVPALITPAGGGISVTSH